MKRKSRVRYTESHTCGMFVYTLLLSRLLSAHVNGALRMTSAINHPNKTYSVYASIKRIKY